MGAEKSNFSNLSASIFLPEIPPAACTADEPMAKKYSCAQVVHRLHQDPKTVPKEFWMSKRL
jgi:hypothetical protein